MASLEEKQGHGRVLEFKGVTKSFAKIDSDGITHALAEIDLTIEPGEFVSIVGTSGCGKSTILRLIAGLIPPTSGEILLGGKPITGAGPDRGMVFQKATLFPWLTIEKNVSFSLRMQKKYNKEKVEKMLKMVGLEEFRKDYPHQLSGGMAQRGPSGEFLPGPGGTCLPERGTGGAQPGEGGGPAAGDTLFDL